MQVRLVSGQLCPPHPPPHLPPLPRTPLQHIPLTRPPSLRAFLQSWPHSLGAINSQNGQAGRLCPGSQVLPWGGWGCPGPPPHLISQLFVLYCSGGSSLNHHAVMEAPARAPPRRVNNSCLPVRCSQAAAPLGAGAGSQGWGGWALPPLALLRGKPAL